MNNFQKVSTAALFLFASQSTVTTPSKAENILLISEVQLACQTWSGLSDTTSIQKTIFCGCIVSGLMSSDAKDVELEKLANNFGDETLIEFLERPEGTKEIEKCGNI